MILEFGSSEHCRTEDRYADIYKLATIMKKMKIFDVAIVGAGPAGSSAAILLGKKGNTVALFDKKAFPRNKICGDGITYKAKSDLSKLGVLEEIESLDPFKLNGYTLVFSDNSTLKFESGNKNDFPAYIISRNDFDNILLKKAMEYSSVEFFPNEEIKNVLPENNGVFSKNNHKYYSKTIIDSSGYLSVLGKHNRDNEKNALAVRAYYEGMENLDKTMEIYFTDTVLPGYFWIFPTSKTSANVGCGTFVNIIGERSISLKNLLNDFIKNHPIASKKFKSAKLSGFMEGGKIPLAFGDFNWSRVKKNLICIGDAGGFVNPITAEGISYAIKTGIIAAETISNGLEKNKYSEKDLKQFDALWKKEFTDQFKVGDIYTRSITKELIHNYFISAFDKSLDSKDLNNPSKIYEYLVKLKIISKSF